MPALSHFWIRRMMLATLRRRDLDAAVEKIATETGLAYHSGAESDAVAEAYRQRIVLASWRFAKIDYGLGFQLVPWRPFTRASAWAGLGHNLVPNYSFIDFNILLCRTCPTHVRVHAVCL